MVVHDRECTDMAMWIAVIPHSQPLTANPLTEGATTMDHRTHSEEPR